MAGQFLLPRAERPDPVQHPVTELVTGIDIVEQQILVADGDTLASASYSTSGHAVETVSGRGPAHVPATDRRSRDPDRPAGIGVDAGVEEGDEVGLEPRPDDREARSGTRPRARKHSTRSPLRRGRPRSKGVTTNFPFLVGWSRTHTFAQAGRRRHSWWRPTSSPSSFPRRPVGTEPGG